MSAWRVSPTDPDATPMQTRTGTALGYLDHYLVDGSKARFILAAPVTPTDVMENVPMRDLLLRVCYRRKLWPRQVTGDTTYGTAEHIVALEAVGIRVYVPLRDFDHRTLFFGRDAFAYDARADTDRCPGGETLRFRTHKFTKRVRVYQAPAATCNACALKVGFTDSTKVRRVTRSREETFLERVRGYHPTESFAKGWASGRSGSSPCSPRRRTAADCGGFGCGDWRTSMSRGC
jgi:hypothetical protein